MLISTYNPNCQATCPKCGLVKCETTGGNIAFGERYMDFHHKQCNTNWRIYLDKKVYTPNTNHIPK